MEFSEIIVFLNNYKEFKNGQFAGEITDEKIKDAQSELSNQIDIIEQEMRCKTTRIVELQNTKQWQRYVRSKKYKGLRYWILYILSLLLVYFLFKKDQYPMSWLPSFWILDFSDAIQLIWKSVLFGVIGLVVFWNWLNLNKIPTIVPRIMARKQGKEIYSLENANIELSSKLNSLKGKLENILTYIKLADEEENIIICLKSVLKCLKEGPKSDTMYNKCYSWVEFLYDIGSPTAEEWEYNVLKCEAEVWLTPHDRRVYCQRRIKEIENNALKNGQYYTAREYMMKYNSSGLPGIDPSVPKENAPPNGAFVPRIDVSDM